VWRGTDSGEGQWKHVPCYKLSSVQDFVVESADALYAIDSNGCSKTTNGGASWGSEKSLDGLTAAKTVTLAPNGDVLVGGTGKVAFSKDGGSTFTRILDTTDSNPVHIVADKDYADNNRIYIAAGDEYEYGEADRNKTWISREPTSGDLDFPSTGDGWEARGIAENEGIIYVLVANGTDSRLYRTQNPRGATADLCLWGYSRTGYEFEAAPKALKQYSGTSFYALDTPNQLCQIGDPIATEGPTLKAPDDGTEIPVNPESGRAYNVTLTWERYHSKYITECLLEVATDTDFEGLIYSQKVYDIDSDIISKVVGPTGPSITTASGTSSGECDFNPGTTYYWRVRVSNTDYGPMRSEWSATRSFSVESVKEPFGVESPVRGASDVSITPTFVWAPYAGATSYEVAVAEDPTFAILDASHSASQPFYKFEDAFAYGTTYHWRVRAIEPEVGPWVTGIFTTMEEPVEEEPGEIIVTPPDVTVEPPEVNVEAPEAAIPTYLLWTIIGIGAVLIIALIVLIVRTRRVA
jgi:hypothetical protein